MECSYFPVSNTKNSEQELSSPKIITLLSSGARATLPLRLTLSESHFCIHAQSEGVATDRQSIFNAATTTTDKA